MERDLFLDILCLLPLFPRRLRRFFFPWELRDLELVLDDLLFFLLPDLLSLRLPLRLFGRLLLLECLPCLRLERSLLLDFLLLRLPDFFPPRLLDLLLCLLLERPPLRLLLLDLFDALVSDRCSGLTISRLPF